MKMNAMLEQQRTFIQNTCAHIWSDNTLNKLVLWSITRPFLQNTGTTSMFVFSTELKPAGSVQLNTKTQSPAACSSQF